MVQGVIRHQLCELQVNPFHFFIHFYNPNMLNSVQKKMLRIILLILSIKEFHGVICTYAKHFIFLILNSANYYKTLKLACCLKIYNYYKNVDNFSKKEITECYRYMKNTILLQPNQQPYNSNANQTPVHFTINQQYRYVFVYIITQHNDQPFKFSNGFIFV